MQKHLFSLLTLLFPILLFSQNYAWLGSSDSLNSLQNRIPVPEGFQRVKLEKSSFGHWLRNIPLLEGKPDVMLFNGEKKWNQSAHHAVVNIDIGKRDLQQCADAVMRLYAEYHYSNKNYQDIHFNYTSGHKVDFSRWTRGIRPLVSGNSVNFRQYSRKGDDYPNFKAYMTAIFNYAGTYSLEKELKKVDSIQHIQAGDVFIKGGFPGHAVIVMDVAEYPATGERAFLLAQSYMPAQNIHILKNPSNSSSNPWYIAKEGELRTPEWNFPQGSLKRFE
ncbi:MAG: DUF4846 domain-containing protein [Bacteroidia bacterium]|nr:DUF4846 domain-containing protein [Bacteroidia bacterium]